MIAALQKAQKEHGKQGQAGRADARRRRGRRAAAGRHALAELKMIRALQMRVNLRTERYADLTKTEQTDTPELLDALKRLAEREQRIHKVTRDIVVGRNR